MYRLPAQIARLSAVAALAFTACTSPNAAPTPSATPTEPPPSAAADPTATRTPAGLPPVPTNPPATQPPAAATPTAASPRPGPTATTGGFPPEIARGDASKPQVALTFDSGSVAGLTAKTLDILKQHQIRSSFFVTGQFAEKNPALVRRMAADGHEIWNHSYSHPDFTTLTDAQIIEEMEKTETILKNITGKTTKPLMRMPFGARDRRVWQVVGNLGYRSVYWTLDSADWREGWTAPMVRDRVISEVGNGFIVVHHSQPAATADALEEIIVNLTERGFQLVPVSTLIGQGGAAFKTVPPDQVAAPNDLLALVNKTMHLPSDYVPPDLVDLGSQGIPALNRNLLIRSNVAPYLKEMLDAASADGLDIQVLSSYRSYQDQQAVFSREVAAVGQAQAERYVARPGQSQHQLGTTVDLTAKSVGWDLSEDFEDTAEGQWLVANAAKYGFVLSYPKGKEHLTGYAYEPWHFRFLGVEVAQLLETQGVLMEEYLARRN